MDRCEFVNTVVSQPLRRFACLAFCQIPTCVRARVCMYNLHFVVDFSIHILDQVRQGLYDFPTDSFGHVSENAKDLIKKLLT
eukprot:794960-Amorphochlora_amoeboformis.AAC.2